MTSKPTLWFLSEVYSPDEQGTAFYTTGLAEGLAKDYPVGVLCSCPTVTARGAKVAKKEIRNGVLVERSIGTTFNKDILALRLINDLTYSAATLVKALVKVHQGDIVLAVTSPPSTPFIAKLVCCIRGARCVLRLEDVYPEIAVATGIIRQKSLLTGALVWLTKGLYRSADQIVVLGRDMKALAEKKMSGEGGKVRIIRSWADTDVISPMSKEKTVLLKEFSLQNKFIVSCIGNMGRAQAIECLFEAATLLKNDGRIHFIFIGNGAKRRWMEQEVTARGLVNVSLVDQRSRSDQSDFINACDISLISLLPGATGAGVPSRTYNVMAAGKPIIAVTTEDCEVALLVKELGIGWVVSPDKPSDLVKAILLAYADPDGLRLKGHRAFVAANERFSRKGVLEEYLQLLGA